MRLSIVIVNYNVAYFLEQCLQSIFDSVIDFEMEIFVVDNNSVDTSISMVSSKFPTVKLIANRNNLGFSKANNQAIKRASGKYILLLNPDTLLEPETLQMTVDFMEANADAGGLGVQMVDGKGNFLPESKRGLPTPAAAFYKIFGISSLFPHHRKFSAYHLGHLDKNEIHEIDVLSGAFMMMRKETLDKVGLLDEDFFMYGEDIDLSYRIIKGGYKNYYFPKTRIIHYKGESTKKDSINYVFVFYKAMIIFAGKHFSIQNAQLFSFLINLAIVFKAAISLVSSYIKKLVLPLADFILLYIGLLAFANYWGPNFAGQTYSYPEIFLYGLIPLFIVINLLTVYYSGGYDRPIKVFKILRGHFTSFVFILIVYALLPEDYRYSRALLLFAIIYIPTITLLWRWVLALFGAKSYEFETMVRKRFLLIGEENETTRVENLLEKTSLKIDKLFKILPIAESLNNLDEIVKINKINELIFCAKDISSSKIIDLMTTLQSQKIDFKIAPPESLFIIGSNSINTSGDIYFQHLNSINNTENKRFKRLFDFILSALLIITFALTIWQQKKPINYLFNILMVLVGKISFVGFDSFDNKEIQLPLVKKGILKPSDGLNDEDLNETQLKRINIIYAREYKVSNDIMIVWKGFKKLYRKY